MAITVNGMSTTMSGSGTDKEKLVRESMEHKSPVMPYVSDRDIEAGPRGDESVVTLKINDLIELCAASDDFTGADLLQQLSHRIGPILPAGFQGYKLFRSGFMFIGSQSDVKCSIDQWTNKLINLVEAPLYINGETINLTADIGIAHATEKGESLQALIDRAVHAQLSSRDVAGSNCNVFDSNQAEKSHKEVTLTQELYRAMDENEFTLHYQPIVTLEDTEPTIAGAEALIRWNHPTRGFISPGEFIPLAEKTGQILFLDRWVLEESARQAKKWNDTIERDVPLGVNISAWQFRDDFLVDKVEEILNSVELNPRLLKIEITETSVMNDTKHAAEMIRGLKDLGVSIALDDFGTGHASFEYLSEFPIDQLKIDRSFLDFDDVYSKNQTLVDVMIQTGKRVGVDILAEGVETTAQMQFVKNRGCHKAQGFLFDKPMNVSDFSEKLTEKSVCVAE